MLKSNPGDIIVCWENGTGLIANYLSLLIGTQRKLVIMNYLTPHKEGKIYKVL